MLMEAREPTGEIADRSRRYNEEKKRLSCKKKCKRFFSAAQIIARPAGAEKTGLLYEDPEENHSIAEQAIHIRTSRTRNASRVR